MGEKGVFFGEKVRGLQGEAGAIRGDERVCRRAVGGVFRQMGDGGSGCGAVVRGAQSLAERKTRSWKSRKVGTSRPKPQRVTCQAKGA